jgi:GT2 family glycosyltransferase
LTAASVVIPTYERADGLRSVLLALARQTAAAEAFEVVVVDDGSGAATASMLAAIDVPYRLVVERQENSGPAAARNRGIAAASGRWCIFIDDDILADPGLVAGHIDAQERSGGMIGIGGLRLRAVGPRGGLAAHFAEWWAEHYRRFEEGEQEPDFWGGFSGNLSAPRETLLTVGGFDEELDPRTSSSPSGSSGRDSRSGSCRTPVASRSTRRGSGRSSATSTVPGAPPRPSGGSTRR